MKTIGISAWMADAGKHFFRRTSHLIEKAGVSGWVWIVRRTNDVTDKMLNFVVDNSPVPIAVIEETWEKPQDRILACSVVGDAAINRALMYGAERVLIHESDLISQEDIALRLGEVLDAAPARAAAAGWPCLASEGMDEILDLYPGAMKIGKHVKIFVDGKEPPLPLFYDTWGYRHDGQRFGSVPPYSQCYRPDAPFRLDTVGSVALIKSEFLRCGARMEDGGFVRLCDRIREMRGEIWCDPRLVINQPVELWTFQNN